MQPEETLQFIRKPKYALPIRRYRYKEDTRFEERGKRLGVASKGRYEIRARNASS